MPEMLYDIKDLNLVKTKQILLSNFNLTINKTERIAITGPSGCGKSTLLKSLIKNHLPKGSTVNNFLLPKDDILSYIPQNNGLLPWFSLQYNLSIFSKEEYLKNDVISQFKLNNGLNSFPHQLSGGEYQRAVLANAIINQPDVFIADEPLTELDITNKWKLLSFWSNFIKKNNSTLLLVSHDIETLFYMCDRIIVLSDKPSTILKEIKLNQMHPRTLDFLTSDEFIKAKADILDIKNNYPISS